MGKKLGMIWFIAILVLVAAGILGLNLSYPGSLGTTDARVQLAYGLILLVVLFSSLAIASRTHHFENTLKSVLAWVAIIMALVTLYTYRDGFQALADNIVATLDPAEPQIEKGVVTIRENSDGHFIANAEVEGVRVRFLVDTGASEVVLSRADAKRIGIDIDELSYTMPVSTANGTMMVAPIRLRMIKVGDIEIKWINAEVAGDGLDGSLLGMSYLRRLSSYEFSRRRLILKE